jgi:hypothetical protein
MQANLGIAALVQKRKQLPIAASMGSVTSFRRQPCDRNLTIGGTDLTFATPVGHALVSERQIQSSTNINILLVVL